MSDIADDMLKLAQEARAAARIIATAPTQQKNNALLYATEALMRERSALEAANSEDIARRRGWLVRCWTA